MRRMLVALLSIIIFVGASTAFAGGCGDVDNSGEVDILDVVYLINFKYKEGPDLICGPETGTVTDIDGNIYQTVEIGNQLWMMENLKVTHYRNGDPIPNVTDNTTWEYLTSGGYCEYDNNIANVATYGRLYNFYAVYDSRNIAPEGWHVPTDDDWKDLERYLGMSQADADLEGFRGTNEGGKLKEAGMDHWLYENAGGTNESGFTALPGGWRHYSGVYNFMGIAGMFWTSTDYGYPLAWRRNLENDISKISRHYEGPKVGLSVRCIKD